MILDYAATPPNSILMFRAINIIPTIHRNTSYLLETKARSRATGGFMSVNAEYPSKNGSVLSIAHIIKTVISSVSEADLGAVYINCHEAVTHRHTLE